LLAARLLNDRAKVAASPVDAVRPAAGINGRRERGKIVALLGRRDAMARQRFADELEALQVLFTRIRIRSGCSSVMRQLAYIKHTGNCCQPWRFTQPT